MNKIKTFTSTESIELAFGTMMDYPFDERPLLKIEYAFPVGLICGTDRILEGVGVLDSQGFVNGRNGWLHWVKIKLKHDNRMELFDVKKIMKLEIFDEKM